MVNATRRLKKLAKVTRIKSTFPNFGISWMKTQATILDSGNSFVNGFISIGSMEIGDINDPFSALNVVGIDGTVENSLMQAGGHDTMDLIYNAYRVVAAVIRFRIADDTQRITNYASTNHTSATTAGTTTMPIFDNFYLVVVVGSDDDVVATTENWHSIMNHPMAFKSSLIQVDLNRSSMGFLELEIPDFDWIMEHYFRNQDTDIDQFESFQTMATGPGKI